jgi:IPT/TIG domain
MGQGSGGFNWSAYSFGSSGGGAASSMGVDASPVAPVGDVAPAPVFTQPASLMQVPAGSTITLIGQAFGGQTGRVGVVAGDFLMGAQVVSWSDSSITVTLPQVGVNSAANAKFVVQRADGSLANEIKFLMVAAR